MVQEIRVDMMRMLVYSVTECENDSAGPCLFIASDFYAIVPIDMFQGLVLSN